MKINQTDITKFVGNLFFHKKVVVLNFMQIIDASLIKKIVASMNQFSSFNLRSTDFFKSDFHII